MAEVTLQEILEKANPEDLANRDCAAITASVNANRTKLGMVERAYFAIWAAQTGLRAKIEDMAADSQSPLRSSALAVRDVLLGAASGFDFSLAANCEMLAAWVSANQVTQEEADGLLALATQPDPADELAVRRLCWSDGGEWLL